jgi:hypothetical protein
MILRDAIALVLPSVIGRCGLLTSPYTSDVASGSPTYAGCHIEIEAFEPRGHYWPHNPLLIFDAGYFKSTARIYVPQFAGAYAANDILVSVAGSSDKPYPLLEIAGNVSFQGDRVVVDLSYASDRLKGPLPYNGNYPLKNPDACAHPPN